MLESRCDGEARGVYGKTAAHCAVQRARNLSVESHGRIHGIMGQLMGQFMDMNGNVSGISMDFMDIDIDGNPNQRSKHGWAIPDSNGAFWENHPKKLRIF